MNPWEFTQDFRHCYEDFQEECKESLRDCGDYSMARTCTFAGVPVLLFEKDALFEEILQWTEEGTVEGLLFEFDEYIVELDGAYDKAFRLYEGLPPSKRSRAAPVHDLFPFHLSITGPLGPWPLVRMKGLLDAYHWTHCPVLVKEARACGSVPSMFMTGDCVVLYAAILRAKIGEWLVKHQAYWLGTEFTASGVVFDSTFGDPTRHPCTVSPSDFHSNYDTDYEGFEEQSKESLRNFGDYTRASFPYGCVPQLLFDGDELFGDILSMAVFDEGRARIRGLPREKKRDVPFAFDQYVAKQDALYRRALELHAGLPPNRQSTAAPVHDLFPFHLAITGPSGPWPLVRIKGLLDAYNWAHSPNLVKETRERGDVPALFLTDECVDLYAIVVRARIGEWLVKHEAYWLGIPFTATGVVPAAP